MPITKAVLACGGWSTRFLPAVKVYAKQLVPILDKPQIQYVMEELLGAGITDFVIVHRDGENSLKDFFTPDPELNAYLEKTNKNEYLDTYNKMISAINSIQFLPQTKAFPYGNGTPIIVAQKFIGHDPFVYLWGDDITLEEIPGAFLRGAINLFNKYHPAVVECVQKVPWSQVHRYGVFKYMKNPKYPNQVSLLVEKPPRFEAPSNIMQGGRFVVSPKIIDVLKQTQIDRGELWFANAVNSLAQTDVVITHNYMENNAKWCTTGDPLNWLKVNIAMAKTKGLKLR
jgi:UTP--glucose-1-phosphate uridylyltransferase